MSSTPELDFTTVQCCMCAFGAEWMKPTQLALWLHGQSQVDNAQGIFSNKICKPVRRPKKSALCQFRECPHVSLTGLGPVGPNGKKEFKTKQAQAYPTPFARAAVLALTGKSGP